MSWASFYLLFEDEAAARAALFVGAGGGDRSRFDPAVLSVARPLKLPVMQATGAVDAHGNPVMEPKPGCRVNIRIRDGAVDSGGLRRGADRP